MTTWVLPLDLPGEQTQLELVGPDDRVVAAPDGLRFDVPPGEVLYLASGPGTLTAPTASGFAVHGGADYELFARAQVAGGAATLWIFGFDESERVCTARTRLSAGLLRIRFQPPPTATTATIALRFEGAGSLQLTDLRMFQRPGITGARGVTAAAVRRLRAGAGQRPLRAYDALVTEDIWTPRTPEQAQDAARGLWEAPPFERIEITPPVPWDSACSAHRSWRYRLHALDPIVPLLVQHSRDGDGGWLEPAFAVVEDWLQADGGPGHEGTAPLAWYDMGVGLRTARIAYLLDAIARDPAWEDRRVARLSRAVAEHCSWLADPEGFAAHSNHGVFQAAGLASAAARLPELKPVAGLRPLAEAMLAGVLGEQFSEEGVHLEHSPGYHAMLTQTLEHVVDAGLVTDVRIVALAAPARAAVPWFVTPAGVVVSIGDSDAEPPVLGARGVIERADVPRVTGWPDAGYVAMRDGGSHLVQICRHHSAVHLHGDLLSFAWHERGHDVLVDPGRFSYLYDDPRRAYVTSTRAHNTVDLPGSAQRSYTDPSELRGWGDAGEAVWSQAEARHPQAVHRRRLVLAPGRWLLVVDAIECDDPAAPAPVQRFHGAAELAVGSWGENGVRLVLPAGDQLWATPLLPAESLGVVVGQTEPELLGWSAPRELEWRAAPSFAFRATGHGPWAMAALFAWDDAPTALSATATGAAVVLGWRAGGADCSVAIAGNAPPDVRVTAVA